VGVAASKTITFDDSTGTSTDVTVAQTVTVEIAGRQIPVQWAPGIGKVAIATALVAAIAAQSGDVPCVATNGGGTLAVVTVTANINGTWGNDISLAASMSGGAGGSVVAGGTALTGGTTEMVLTTALATIIGQEYDLICLATSNADAASAAGTSGPAKVRAQMTTVSTGFGAKLQQCVVGYTSALSSAKTGVAAQNFGPMEYVIARGMRSLPCELAGAETGARLREEGLDPDVNRTNRTDKPYVAVLYTSKTLTTDAFTAPEMEDALQSGLSPVDYNANGAPYVKIPRTTYFKDVNANPDHRLVFVSQVSSVYAVAKDLRTYLPVRFAGAKVVPTLTPGDDEIPPNVVDEDTVTQVALARVRLWQRAGVVRKDKLDAAVKAGTFRCQVDSGNASKMNCQFPTSIVPPLTTFDVSVLGS
jgi:phage tail sheath gpL-like